MALPAQQIYLPEFDADFFNLPQSQQGLIEAKIDALGRRLATFPMSGSRAAGIAASVRATIA
jgi:hypothetical protein